MSNAGELVARLAEAGIDAHLLSDVAQALFTAEAKAEILDARRKKDRERKPRKSEEIHGTPRKSNVSEESSENPSPNENILTPTREEKPEPKGSVKKFVLPTDIPAEPWGDFEEMRQRIRKPMTVKAKTLAVAELRRLRDEEGWPPGDVLNHCTLNSYQGIYPPKRNRTNDGIGKTSAAIAGLGHWDDDRPM